MMRYIVVYAMLGMLAVATAGAQGFNWQYSARFPVEAPTRFAGIDVSSGYTVHSGRLNYIETQTGFTCCEYGYGNGLPFRLAIGLDNWISPNVSLQGSLGVTVRGANFVSDLARIPRRDAPPVETQYTLDGSITYGVLQAGIRYRIPTTHINVGAGLRGLIKLASSSTQTRTITRTDNGVTTQTETVYPTSIITDAQSVLLEPFLLLAYDIPLIRGMYVSPTMLLAFPLISTSSEQSWYVTDIGLGLRIMKGF